MAGEQSAKDSDATTRLAELPDATEPRGTPNESTVGMVSSPTVPPPGTDGADVGLLVPGETLLGRFTVVRFIAGGGMGAVYEAMDSVLRTPVALKLIRRRIAQDGTAMQRFRREVLLARQVGHPNVCRVYELYEAKTSTGEPIQFLTMELLLGETLSRKLGRGGRLSTLEALPLVRQMCAGLAAAHAEGVVHRDFKSSNVMLVPKSEASGGPSTEATRVAITDFGVARALTAAGGEERLTGEAGVLGTPEYMAPEQVTGGEVTPATDIYALGVVLYEMVTGKLPFTGDTPLVAAARRLNEEPPRPELESPGLETRWSNTIVRCLAREPKKRFANPVEVSEALGGQPGRKWRPLPAAVLALAALLLGALAATLTVPRLQAWRARRSVAVAAPRPVAAILGFANNLPLKSLAWLPTAIEEMLHQELSAAETSLRVLPTNRVADARQSLDVTAESLSDQKARTRLQGLLVANRLLHGRLVPAVPGSDGVQLQLHLLDGPTGTELAVLSESLGPGAARLPETIAQLGARVREVLHASLTPEEEAALTASRVKQLEAAQAYAEGVTSIRTFDYSKARTFLTAALALDSSLVGAQRRLGESWQLQGYQKEAREVVERLASNKQLLTPGQAAEFTARARLMGPDSRNVSELRMALFNARPDDEDFGIEVAADGNPSIALAVVKRLRQLPHPLSDDLRLDLAEARAISTTDPARAHAMLDRVESRANELGARYEQGQVLLRRGGFLNRAGRGVEAVVALRKAFRLFSETGNLRWAAGAGFQFAYVSSEVAPIREALATTDEVTALYRRLGHRAGLTGLLPVASELAQWAGDAELAKKRLDEAYSEAELLGDDRGDMNFSMRIKLLRADAEGKEAWSTLQQWKKETGTITWLTLPYEAMLLWDQDRLAEAVVTQKRGVLAAEQEGSRQYSTGNQLKVCRWECDQGHIAEGLACLESLPSNSGTGLWHVAARGEAETQCKYLAKDFPGAEAAARAVLSGLARDPGYWFARVPTEIALGRAMAANGKAARAVADLKARLAEIESRRGYTALAFEARLALGEAELMSGIAAGRARLARLEQDAKQRESFRIARLAREALDRKPVAPAARQR